MKTSLLLLFVYLLSLRGTGQDEVMAFKQLQNYLPVHIDGYTAGEPGGQSISIEGLTFSSADIEFTNTDGDFIKISLLDYAGASTLYQTAAATWQAGVTYESDDITFKQVTWNEHISGWEQYHKTERKSIIALGIANRFFLTIEASNQDNLDLVISIAENMDLDKLALK